MAQNDITLDGTVLTPFGRKLSETIIEIARETRTASGRKVKDVITTKKEFTLSYSMIDGDELAVILAKYSTLGEHTLIIKDPDTTSRTYTVLMKPYSQSRVIILADGLYGNVRLRFEEV